MKIYCVVAIAKQVEGEIISIRFEKAFKEMSAAEEYITPLNKDFKENIQTEWGVLPFECRRRIHEIELE